MSSIGKRGAKSGEYSVIYSNMRGVDKRGDGSAVSRNRFADIENMYKDYEGGGEGAIESIPGYRRLLDLSDELYGLFSYKNEAGDYTVCAHAGEKLASFPLSSVSGTASVTYYTGLNRNKSAAFSHAGALYILDGKKILKTDKTGTAAVLGSESGAYIPTLYKNGTEYEQINLLTDNFYESFLIGSAASAAYGSPELKYAITDAENKKCAVSGIEGNAENVYIPAVATIGGEKYEVAEIADYAFRNDHSIKTLFIADGLTRIGFLSFDGCTALESAILPETLITIAEGAFGGCVNLTRVHLGSALREIGTYAFNLCGLLRTVTYSRDRSIYENVIGKNQITVAIQPNSASNECYISVSLHAPTASVTKITINGLETDIGEVITGDDGLIREVLFRFEARHEIEGKEIVILGKLSKRKSDYTGMRTDFLGTAYLDDSDTYSIIGSCSVAESFDGTIFLTGNPKYPGYTFYSARNSSGEMDPLYFGSLNYFLDGEGSFANIALLATADALAIFKETDGGGGSIFYRTPKETGIDLLPKIYPTSSIHTGFAASGKAISFFDDPVFVSKKGVCALTKKTVNLERSIAVRSTNVNPSLLSEDISSASLAVWQGYLCVCVGGKIYLADSRDTFSGTEGFEYEWYILTGIGAYKNDRRVYRYKSTGAEGFSSKPGAADRRATATVLSAGMSDGTVYYTEEDGERYEVYPTEEMTGGEFSAARYIVSVDGRLIFGTGTGVISIFNSDKKGLAPDGKGEDEAPPKSKLHPYYYSFDHHAPRYALKTAKDSCGKPHLSKSTVKHSLAMKLKSAGSGSFTAEVFCDTRGYRELCDFPSGKMSFSDMDFSSLTLETEDSYTVPLSEREKRWVEKQIAVYTDEYESPFGVYSIAYRFTVEGKIKKNR